MEVMKQFFLLLAMLNPLHAVSIGLMKKQAIFLPDRNGRFEYDSGTATKLSYDARSRLIYSTGFREFHIIELQENLSLKRLALLLPQEANFALRAVRVCRRYIIMAMQNLDDDDDGRVTISRRDGYILDRIQSIRVGPNPRDLAVSKNCKKILVTVRGSSNMGTAGNTEGSVVMIDFLTFALKGFYRTRRMGFGAFDGRAAELERGGFFIVDRLRPLRFDIEPEYLRLDERERRAYVTLQANNAIAVVDIFRARVTDIYPLGYKDFSLAGQGFDASVIDGYNIRQYPVFGLYQPEGITCMSIGRETYLITGNEGAYRRGVQEISVRNLTLDPTAFPNAHELQMDDQLGELDVFTTLGDTDGDGDYDELYSIGARSISVWSSDGSGIIADSKDSLERLAGTFMGDAYNADNFPFMTVDNSYDLQSGSKGPEPGDVESMSICSGKYQAVFVANERPGLIAAFTLDRENLAAGFTGQDVAFDKIDDPVVFWDGLYAIRQISLIDPNDLVIVEARDSPTRKPLLLVASAKTGTVSVYEIEVDCNN